MGNGIKKIAFSTVITRDKIQQIAPGINSDTICSLALELDEIFKMRRSPVYIFIKPDLEKYAEKLHVEVKDLFSALQFLTGYVHDAVKFRAILIREEEELFHILDAEELEELETKNTLLHPEDPRRTLIEAKKYVRHAFVIQPNLDQ